MPWTYEQSTGRIWHGDGPVLGMGYSGADPWKNATGAEQLHERGPIPRGKWMIGDEVDSQVHGPVCIRLLPAAGTDTFGRAGFMIHGDGIANPGDASRGCVILPRSVRMQIAASSDRELRVV